ncbi:MAG: hypothetical protein R3F34_10290 [Planctomycetota bacterium]
MTYFNAGSAFVVERDGLGQWSVAAELVPHSTPQNEAFGGEVAYDGQTVAIGAIRRTVSTQEEAGAVEVFERGAGGSWIASPPLTDPSVQDDGHFRTSIAVEDGLLAVGAQVPIASSSMSAIPRERGNPSRRSRRSSRTRGRTSGPLSISRVVRS